MNSFKSTGKARIGMSILASLVRLQGSNSIRDTEKHVKYLAFIRHAESFRQAGPPPSLMDAMGKFVQKSLQDGSLVDTGGLLPSKDGFRVRLTKGAIVVTDGPFIETKEVIGGWAILNASSREEALRIAREFMELHRTHWPEFEGESEVRPMFDPGMGP